MNSRIKFTKMHGLGNDFIFIEKRDLPNSINIKEFVINNAHRNTGLGCDQLILFAKNKDIVDMEIYNADGSNAKACGNATRCLAHMISNNNLNEIVRINVSNRILECEIYDNNLVSVNMGNVNFEASWMPNFEILSKKLKNYIPSTSEFVCVDVGNPHLVIIDKHFENEDMKLVGPKFEKSELFPDGVNVNFAELSGDSIKLKVWERGTGFTYACGSGACASFAACRKLGFLCDEAKVHFELGSLSMKYHNGEIIMKGPVTYVASGELIYG